MPFDFIVETPVETTQQRRQRLFNTALEGVVRQGGLSLRAYLSFDGNTQNIRCAYRGLDGRKCAVGHLIPDHLYRPYIEGTFPKNLEKYGLHEEDRNFLRQLQCAHDASLDSSNHLMRFRDHMLHVACSYGLEF